MPTVRCQCGMKYKVADAALGKRARCKKCGETFELRVREEADIEFEPVDLGDLARGTTVERAAGPGFEPVGAAVGGRAGARPARPAYRETAAAVAAPTRERGPWVSYFLSLPRAFVFLTRAHNIKTFLFVWFIVTVGALGGSFLAAFGGVRASCLGLFAMLVTEGTFAAFCFNTVRQSAEGEDELPAVSVSLDWGELWGTVIVPFFCFLATCFLAVLPALVYTTFIENAVPEDKLSGVIPYLPTLGLLALGLFMWPMIMLVLTMGGGRALLRLGGMSETVLLTFPAYFCTVLLVYGCAALMFFVAGQTGDEEANALVLAAALMAGRVFTQTAAMRAIGIYYKSFEHRFEWL